MRFRNGGFGMSAGEVGFPTMNERRFRSVGELVKYYRHLRGLGQDELAQRAGLAQGTLSNIENDKMAHDVPKRAQIDRLAEVLGISPTEFVRAAGYPLEDDADAAITARFEEMRHLARTMPGISELERRRLLAGIDLGEETARKQVADHV